MYISGENDFYKVYHEIVSIKSTYYQLGIALGLPTGELDSIRAVPYYDVDQAFCAVLLLWLRQRYDVDRHGPPTWRRLVEAVDSPNGGNNTALAMNIASRHPSAGNSIIIIIMYVCLNVLGWYVYCVYLWVDEGVP